MLFHPGASKIHLKEVLMPEKAVDPVCGMEVDPNTAPAKLEYKGRTFYFCAPGCKALFEKDPEKYLRK